MKYQMKEQWSNGQFNQAVVTQKKLVSIIADLSEFEQLQTAETFVYPALNVVLNAKPGTNNTLSNQEVELFKINSEASIKTKAKFGYLRGLEGLNVSKNYEQAK